MKQEGRKSTDNGFDLKFNKVELLYARMSVTRRVEGLRLDAYKRTFERSKLLLKEVQVT